MADPSHFEPRTPSKRKRTDNHADGDDADTVRISKKSGDHLGLAKVYDRSLSPNYMPVWQPLTPVDSSDDDTMWDDEDIWAHRRSLANNPNRLSRCSMSSVRVNVDDADDEMDVLTSPTAVSELSDTPSATCQSPDLLTVPTMCCAGRSLTPMATHFRSLAAEPASPFHRQNIYSGTATTSATGRESNQHIFQRSSDTTAVDSASNSFGSLSVRSHDDIVALNNTQMSSTMLDRGDTEHLPDCPRKATLHMGYRADCQKCVEKISGHYNHILWV